MAARSITAKFFVVGKRLILPIPSKIQQDRIPTVNEITLD